MWLKIDDAWLSHRKIRRATKDGRALWVAAAVLCAKAQTDVLESLDVSDAAHHAEVKSWQKVAGILVDVGLWHDSTSTCDRCEPTPKGAYRFHDWWEYQPTRDEANVPAHVLKWRRKKALHRDRDLCERIVKRDRNRCRYCAERVNWRDRRGDLGGTYDHVDPDGDNSLRNVVVACRGCNILKADRTPEEAGMVLLPAGSDLAPAKSGQKKPGPKSEKPGSVIGGGDGPGSDLADLVWARSSAPSKVNGNGKERT